MEMFDGEGSISGLDIVEPQRKKRKHGAQDDRAALPEFASDWRSFRMFERSSGSWGPFNIEIRPCHIEKFPTELIRQASKDCGLPLCDIPEDLQFYEAFEMYTKRLRRLVTPVQESYDSSDSDEDEAENKDSNMIKIKRAEQFISQEKQELKKLDQSEHRFACKQALEFYHGFAIAVRNTTAERSPATITEHKKNPEYLEKAALLHVVNSIFRYWYSNGPTHAATLTPLTSEYKKSMVRCEPDLEIRAEVEYSSSEHTTPGRHILCVGQIEKDCPSPNLCISDSKESDALKQHCRNSIHKHLAQLLVCMRESLFAQDWSEAAKSSNTKLSLAGHNYIFGILQHKSRVQLTCLRLSKDHLCRIVKGLRTAQSNTDHSQSMQASISKNRCKEEPVQTVLELGLRTIQNNPDQTPISHASNSGELGKEDPAQTVSEPGQLYVSDPFDLTDVFHEEKCLTSGLLHMMRFFVMLAQYQNIYEVTANNGNRYFQQQHDFDKIDFDLV